MFYTLKLERFPGWRGVRSLIAPLALLVGGLGAANVATAQTNPNQGPGGPILVITSPSSTFGRYYAEILRTEGLNSFAVADISTVSASTLAPYDVVILSRMTLSGSQVTTLTNWVTGGGNLIAMDPDAQLANLLGITASGSSLANGYLLVDTSTSIGSGIVGQTIQFHGTARLFALNGASRLATLYSNATTATPNPALTLRSVGSNGGQAAAFAYDLATSIVYTRQGNPAWDNEERDGFAPIRSDDKFFGNAAGDPQLDWVDLSKVSIPQADEQQRLLANLIIKMNLDRKPLPRFWYLPNGHRAAVLMSGDDHANGGTAGRFDQFIDASPPGCSVANWECVRGTSYIYPNTPLSNSQLDAYEAAGFEVGLHVNTGCADFTPSSLENFYANQIANFQANYPSLSALSTQRHHCIVWSDWASGAKVQLNHGMRLDTSYYYWPPGWVSNTPGHFTGSAMPMRFADLDGTLIDVYQAVTQMTDESSQEYPFTVNVLLDRALGLEEQYGVFTVNAHTDLVSIPESDAVVSSALARGVPIVSARQMLTWLDGRNRSSFGSLAWSANSLSFTVVAGSGSNGLTALIPRRSATATLSTITRNSNDVPYEILTVKGIEYASFLAVAGSYVATYAIDAGAPTVVARSPSPGATGVPVNTTVSAVFNEAMDPTTVNSNTIELRNSSNALVPATVTYTPASFTATLTPTGGLAFGATYTVTIQGGATDPRVKDVAGNALAADVTWSFTTVAASSCPCSIWNSTASPTVASDSDTGGVEIGVKFRSDINGFITGLRFYKGSNNTGTHVGHLWSTAGQLLATATFTNETATGWQQVNLANPVAITANTVYIASYHAPNGRYAGDNSYFSTSGVDNGVLHALQNGVSGGNGVYAYGASGSFPSSTFQSTNYWVDVVFNTSGGGSPDTTPPSVTITAPTNLATFSTSTSPIDLSGTASDNLAVTQVSWANDRGGNGVTSGTTSWSVNGVVLQPGTNVLTVTASDATPNTSNDVLTVTYTPAADTTPPTVTTRAPAAGATGVPVSSVVTATFSEALDPATVSSSTVELRNGAGTLVPASVTYGSATFTATLDPTSDLLPQTTYTVTVRGGATDPRVKDSAGNALAANVVWSFTTAAADGCPCSLFLPSQAPTGAPDTDPGAVELGTRFRTNANGDITAIRFYKNSQNTGAHAGHLWTSTGTLLATATFSGETASGWQQANLSTPVSVTANTWYIVSYHTSAGSYIGQDAMFATSGITNGPLYAARDGEAGANGVYSYGASGSFPNQTYNSEGYWVDVVFSSGGGAPDTTPPTVTTRSPASGATGVAANTSVTATFSEALDASTVTASTFELRNSANVLVASTVSYNATALTATLTPTSILAASATYTATLRGGATDPRIKDTSGNALAANSTWSFTTAAAGGNCSLNVITAENCLTGNPSSEWDINGAGDSSIQGYAAQISVNRGSTVQFKVNTNANGYRFDIYRMGYYGGLGARRVATVNPSASLPQSQPSCLTQPSSGLIDCGNWALSGSWAVPSNAVSGIYFAKAVRTDNGGASHIMFIVRNDSGTSDLVFQTSDTTWQAYNSWGGNSLYTGSPGTGPNRAYKVSYNRPFNTRIVDNGQDWVFNAEYPAVRWLERNGYDVSYIAGADTDRAGSLLTNHRAFLSVGHDEYWSGAQRTSVETARNAGVHLAFLSGNEIFWKTRWENSIDGSGTSYRTLVTYKETHADAKIDPNAAWTGTWRDPRFSPPADGGRPENALSGTAFAVNSGTTGIEVPEADGKMRLWRNTSVATLGAGQTAQLPDGTLGYEWDIDPDNGFRPAGLVRMSTTTVSGVDLLQDHGSSYATGTATHHLTLYRHSSGARIFGAGTIQWTWGLDATHDRAGTPSDSRMQQATVNVLADMGVQPATLQSGLVPATQTSDSTRPTSVISSPAAGATVQPGVNITISGTATDSGGGLVGGVEVSVDDGTTWHPATGRGNWTYIWTPSGNGSVTIRTRAADDSGNVEVPGAGRTVTVGGGGSGSCPCSLWLPSQAPAVGPDIDPGAVTLGTRFRTSVNGTISAIRFYKNSGNTGTHVGNLWTATGTLLATVTFSGETASGWQQAQLPSPVAVTANTWYVVSYHTSAGSYIGQDGMFASSGLTNGPLYAARDGEGGANGLYRYGASGLFPNLTYNSEGYWVDVVFNQ